MTTMTYTAKLTVIECADCHITFGIGQDLYAELRANHKTFWCPKGHPLSFPGKSDEERLQEELAREKRWRASAETRLTATRDQLGATERSLRGHKAAKTRIKNRIAAGVCPCCNRSFQNVARHMSGQHPEFGTTEESTN